MASEAPAPLEIGNWCVPPGLGSPAKYLGESRTGAYDYFITPKGEHFRARTDEEEPVPDPTLETDVDQVWVFDTPRGHSEWSNSFGFNLGQDLRVCGVFAGVDTQGAYHFTISRLNGCWSGVEEFLCVKGDEGEYYIEWPGSLNESDSDEEAVPEDVQVTKKKVEAIYSMMSQVLYPSP